MGALYFFLVKAVLFLITVATAVSTALVVRNNERLKKRIGRQATVTSPSVDCVCVPFYLCSANNTLNKFGVTLINIRRNTLSPCAHYLDVCCGKGDMILHFTPSTIGPSSNKPLSFAADNALVNSTSSSSNVVPTSTDAPDPTSLSNPISTNKSLPTPPSTNISSSNPLPVPETNNMSSNISTSNSTLSKVPVPTTNDSTADLPVFNSPLPIPPTSEISSPSSPSTDSPLPSSSTANVPLPVTTESTSQSPTTTTPIGTTGTSNNSPTPTLSISLPISPSTNVMLLTPSSSNPSSSSASTKVTSDKSPSTDSGPLPTTSSTLSDSPISNTTLYVSTSNNNRSSLPSSSTPSILEPTLPSNNIPLVISLSPNSSLNSSSTSESLPASIQTPETSLLSNLREANTLLSSTPATDTLSFNTPTTSSSSSNAPTTDTLSSNTPTTNSSSSNAPTTDTLLSNTPTTNFPSSNAPTTSFPPSSNAPTDNPLPSTPSDNVPFSISATTMNLSSTSPPVNGTSSVNEVLLPEDPEMNVPTAVTKDNYVSRGCGFSNDYGFGFHIIGNKYETQFAEFPWVVALLLDDEKFICGGSLIHPKVVLTSAHCVMGDIVDKLVARAGEWDRGTTKEILPHQDRKIDEIVIHEHFHSGALLNDVALLILKESMNLIDNVDVVCLPTQDFEFDLTECVASGWGKDNFNSQNYQIILKKVHLPLVERDSCQAILRKTRLGQIFELHESFICAGGKKDQDTCKGDGGSPLMCPLRDDSYRYQQAGIVAWGIGCGDVNPGVYAKVSHFRDWIDSQLKKRNIALLNV